MTKKQGTKQMLQGSVFGVDFEMLLKNMKKKQKKDSDNFTAALKLNSIHNKH